MKQEEGFSEQLDTQSTVTETDEQHFERKKKKRRRWLYALLAIGIAVISFVGGFFTYYFWVDEEMRMLIRIKNKIQQEYYEEVTDTAFYDAVFQSVEEYKRAGNYNADEDFYKAAFAGINQYVLDEYSWYMTEAEYEAMQVQSTGKQSGIGAYFLTATNDLVVHRVAGNSPAEDIGMEKGDVIVGVGASADTIQPCYERKDYSSFVMNVDFGESFYVQWQSEDGQVQTEELLKAEYVENYIFYKTNTLSYGFERKTERGNPTKKSVGAPLSYLDEDTAYVKIVQFNGDASEAFDSAMTLFQQENKKHLVVDLRGNGGGYMKVLRGIGKYFCKNTDDKRPTVAIADYGEKIEKFKAYDNVYAEYFSEDSRITVLADTMTASASECLIGCMYGYGAIAYEDICLVEEANGKAKTFGKGIMQTTYPMLGDGALKLTTAKIFWPTEEKYSIHGVGVQSTDGAKTVSYALGYTEQTKQAIQTLYA